jgi:hypothetical protein
MGAMQQTNLSREKDQAGTSRGPTIHGNNEVS